MYLCHKLLKGVQSLFWGSAHEASVRTRMFLGPSCTAFCGLILCCQRLGLSLLPESGLSLASLARGQQVLHRSAGVP
jgi:hypothetical protein